MQPTQPLKDILQAGLLAPSADNHHRLRFEPIENGVLVWSDPGRLKSLTGYERTLDLLSLGAVLENISLRASANNLATTMDILPPSENDLVARVRFSPTSSEPDILHTAIPTRHTNRLFFTGSSAPAHSLEQIGAAVRAESGCMLDWLDDAERRRKMLRLIRLAEGERFRNEILHAEMFRNICFSVGWNQTCEEGLPPGALGIAAPLRPFFSALRHWPLMACLNRVGAYLTLGWRAGDLPCRFSPHIGVISTASLADYDQINAGRTFERVWLATTLSGLSLQPMPASALYAQQASIKQGISSRISARLSQGWEELQINRVPLMVFRIGYAKAPGVVSGRKPLQEYLPKR